MPRGAPVESATEAPVDDENRSQHSNYSPTHWSYCSFLIILARPDATVAMGWLIAHKKTPPMEPTVRPSNGVGFSRLGSDRPCTKYDFSGTPWRWMFRRHMVPVTTMGSYLTQKPTLYAHCVVVSPVSLFP